jgi:hypothetical protein
MVSGHDRARRPVAPGTWRLAAASGLAAALAWSCTGPSPVAALTDRDCPAGARVVGAAPPAGHAQRCELPGGIRHGTSRAWYDDGRPRYETEWWQGVKHGTFTLWYPNGRKRAEGRDRHGIPDGTWRSWSEDGRVLQAREFTAADIDVAAARRDGRADPGRD